MDSPQIASPVVGTFSGQTPRSRSSTKLADDVTSLTSFNPFAEEDENDQSSYALVTSLFSKVKSTLSAPLSTTTPAQPSTNAVANGITEQRRPSYTVQISHLSFSSKNSGNDKPNPLNTKPSGPAPPLVSLTPVHSELPLIHSEYERSPSREGSYYPPAYESPDGGFIGTAIPGFPVVDDARSIKTSASLHRSGSVSKVIRRLRGEGLSRDYWMDDQNCRECYDCKSIFTTWRRRHHCRICGQIFCSRCASNIIEGTRFRHNGMVRVCNLCLEKLAKADDDDDDDRRSFVSSVTSFPAHQLGNDSLTLAHHPQSPFAASQIFGRTDEPFNLYSIAETKRLVRRSDGSGFSSNLSMPQLREREDGVWEPIRENPAPFRRALSDEEKDSIQMSHPFDVTDSMAARSGTPIEFPQKPVNSAEGGMSSIQFPMGSPERGQDSPQPPSRLRSRFNSYGEFDGATPFIRSRVQSRLDNTVGEPGWRTRRESTAYAQELNLISMLHLKVMLRQMLTSEHIPNINGWEETLLKLALRIAKELTFTTLPHRQGEDMDVRRYVKIKKIPGGAPQDSEYVDGAVITKNVAHKQMSRFQRNPRVMLVTFPLEFHRVEGQYMHFGQIVRQEKEYLGNLASRIAALRPHVVLVEKSVSRIALEALVQHNIAVARTVKPSAIQFVARMTQGDIFSSMDKLALEPRLGHCTRFRIQTFDHPLIPGRRKTYMRFEGCSRDMGCTIILRGEDIGTLRKLKKVTRFLTFIVRNLKLETHLWKDSVITLPSFNPDAFPPTTVEGRRHSVNLSVTSLLLYPSLSTSRLSTPTAELGEFASTISTVPDESDDGVADEDAEQIRLSRRIEESLESYKKTFISVSATLRFPPPYPIRRMKELDIKLQEAKRAWEDEVIRREEKVHSTHKQETTVTPATATISEELDEKAELRAQIEALPILNFSTATTPGENGLPTGTTDEGYFSIPTNTTSITALEEPMELLKTPADIAIESHYHFIKRQHEEQRRIWEWYLRKNCDDFVVEKYQCISLWEYTIPIAEFGLHQACFAPRLNYITFYGENDCTLGQYIEKAVAETLVQFLNPKAICKGKGCDQPLARHCTVYVHNETRLFVAVEQWDGQIIGHLNYSPTPELVTTWSACRVCGSATPFIPVSEEMQRYSFAKFLELHFYPADVKLVQGAGCEHNIYQHHIRYFALKGMTVRFQADPIILHEVVYPPMRIHVRPETQLELKNRDFDRLHRRNLLWYSALIDDLRLISIDAAIGDEKADAKLLADINLLISRAAAEREEISQLINRLYRESPPTDTLVLNQVHAFRQDRIVAWQQDFDKLPKPRPPPGAEKIGDKGTRKSSAFGSVRAMWPKLYDFPPGYEINHVPSSSVSEAEDNPLNVRQAAGGIFTSSASEASEPEMDTSKELVDQPTTEPEPETEQQAESLLPHQPPPPISSVTEAATASISEPESDSTIGATKDDAVSPEAPSLSPNMDKQKLPGSESTVPRLSRLPRRSVNQPSVAELVKKYSDYLPPQGVHELAKTALPPRILVSESEQEYPSIAQYRTVVRSKGRHRLPTKKSSVSDFEQGYTANIAPRYLTHSRRGLAPGTHNSRIPGPIVSAFESRGPSRRQSPEKRSASGKAKEIRFGRSPSPPNTIASNGNKVGKGRPPNRSLAREKVPPRTASNSGTKSTFRRPTGGSRVSTMARFYERMSRDAERSKNRYTVIRGKRARPVSSARAKVEILDSIKDAVKDESETSDSSSEADDEGDGNESSRLLPDSHQSPQDLEPQAEASAKPAPPEACFSIEVQERPLPIIEGDRIVQPPPGPISLPSSPFLKPDKVPPVTSLTPPPSDQDAGGSSIFKAISGLWQPPPPTLHYFLESDDLLSDPEHIFRDSSMVVRTDEPTSIIALALNSPQYRDMLAKSRADKRTAQQARLTDGGEVFMPDDKSIAESTSTWGVVNVDAVDTADPTEDLRVPSSKLPWAITFESGGFNISCTVLYPEQFDALRRTYDCEKSMIESLARCVKWNANGGKSGSAFLKTRDDRFIAKEISRAELQTMETFAPVYFDYMSSSVLANRPTLLAKVFGCYKLTFKKSGKDKGPSKSKSMQMNLLVMENLFYDRRFSKIYDLKGSTRNRHVQSTGRENEVLLDENLVQTAHLAPFYLREHSKRILRGALHNDTKFLADINVMDYSLVVGIAKDNNELVVGIVDYIRTYTWDKRLESWVKESAFLGGAGKGEPTIVTPKQYRQRFISAMERYFPLIPDRWMKQKDTPEEDSNSLTELWPDW